MNEQKKLNRINKKISAAFLLTNVAYVLINEAEDEAKEFGGLKYSFKLNINKAKKGLEEYQVVVNREVQKQGKGFDFLKDFEVLDKFVQDFINSGEEEPLLKRK